MYVSPKKYRCPKCKFEFDYSPSIDYSFLAVNEGKPICYKCMIKFLAKNVPTMEVVDGGRV